MPAHFCLAGQHSIAIAGFGALLLAFLHKSSDFRIVHQVEKVMVGGEGFVREVRAVGCMGPSAERGGVDDQAMVGKEATYLGISDFPGYAWGTADGQEIDAEVGQDIANCFGGSAVAQNQGFGDWPGNKIQQSIQETVYIGIIAGQKRLSFFGGNFHAIYGFDILGYGIDGIQVGENRLFIGNSDIDPSKVWMGV